MTGQTQHPLAQDYLRGLDRAARILPAPRREELMAEIANHLAETIPAGATDAQAREALLRLGSPEEIIEAEQPSPAPSAAAERRSWREWAAVILLPLGGFVFGVGWLAGLILLWSSRLWTTRDKLIGTLIVPGGIATAFFALILAGTRKICSQETRLNVTTGALAKISERCRTVAGPGTAAQLWHIALIVFCVLGPLVSAVYLARRARTAPRIAG
jgi:uncharacterized membrane protein